MKKLVSVIIPIYKVEKYLKECIESVINQTYTNLEIILIDDGSPDNCGKICDDYAKKDKRIRVIHKENGGLSSARNAGLEIATGEYISFIDSDDYVANNFIEVLYRLCVDNNADIAECDFQKFEDEPKIIPIEEQIFSFSSIEMQNRLYSEYGVRTVIVCNKLYRKDIYSELKFPNGKINEDEYTTYKVLDKAKKIVITNQKLYYYRYNDLSITNKKFNIKRLDAIDAFLERKHYYKKKNYFILYEKTVVAYQKILKKMFFLTLKNIDEPKIYLEEIRKKMIDNYHDYKKIKDISLKDRILMSFFIKFPIMYYKLKILIR